MDDSASIAVPREDSTATLAPNMVWVPHPRDVWSLARVVVESEETVVAVPLTGGLEEEYPLSETHSFDASHLLDLDDISKLNNLHEAPLLDLLRRRFNKDVIYTNVGDVLISINPYKRIPLLYDMDMHLLMGRYATAREEVYDVDTVLPSEQQTIARNPERPHVYTIADRAFRSLTEKDDQGKTKNQSIVISGESGAGKTEASKYVMRYLISVSQVLTGEVKLKDKDPSKAPESKEDSKIDKHVSMEKDEEAELIESMLIESNVILEAFGNAKTMRNDNSSRFGKYIRLLYSEDFRLIGAETEHFLLEQSRLVQIENGERNYHIFYQLAQGLTSEEREAFHVGFPETFRLCNMGETLYVSERIDDGGEWENTLTAMTQLGISAAEQREIKNVLAALLHMGNLDFTENNLLADGRTEACSVVDGEVTVEGVAEMLGTSPANLKKAITARMITSGRGSVAVKHLTRSECVNNVKGCIKFLYTHLFSWLVRKINYEHGNMNTVDVPTCFIGILDIFGFEIMRLNSFEQFCINFANEALQQHFNQHIFVLEQEQYRVEALDTAVVSFKDNQPIIDLVAGTPSLLQLLEAQAVLNTMTSVDNFVRSAHKEFKQHPNYTRPKGDQPAFTISHFAGEVYYDATEFIAKNNDSLTGDLVELFKVRSNTFVMNILNSRPKELQSESEPGYIPEDGVKPKEDPELDLPLPPKKAGRSAAVRRRFSGASASRLALQHRSLPRQNSIAGNVTVSKQFRAQVKSLTDTLSATQPHYIKCIKPNNVKAPAAFGPRLVLTQLRYSGVLEVVRIRREGYPSRMGYLEFYEKYEMLIPRKERMKMKSARQCRLDNDVEYAKEACLKIAKMVLDVNDDNKEFQMGTSLLFMRDNGLDKMDAAVREFYASHASRITGMARLFIAKRNYKRTRQGVVVAQAFARMAVCKRQYQRQREAARTIQEKVKSIQAAQLFADKKSKVVVIQALFRQGLAMKKFSRKSRENKGALKMQSVIRGFLDRRRAAKKRSEYSAAQVVISKCLRRRQAQAKYAKSVRDIIALQTAVRGFIARKHFATAITLDRLRRAREKKMATRIQATVRMMRSYRQFQTEKRSATLISASYRKFVIRAQFLAMVKALTLLQASQRRRMARTAYLAAKRAAILMQTAVRMFLAMQLLRRAKKAVHRIEIAGFAFLRNLVLSRTLEKLFDAAERGQGGEVEIILAQFPHLALVRQRTQAMRTLLHAAARSGDEGTCDVVFNAFGENPDPNLVLAKTLEPSSESALHVAASTGQLAVVQHLVSYIETEHEGEILHDLHDDMNTDPLEFMSPNHFKRKTMNRASAYKSGLLKRRNSNTAAMMRAQQLTGVSASLMTTMSVEEKPKKRGFMGLKALSKSNESKLSKEEPLLETVEDEPTTTGEVTIMKQGWLKKRRETDRWQKRWCVLTNTELKYYHRVASKKPSKVVDLTGAIVKKSEQQPFTFEIHSPLLLDRRNREGRIYFKASSEIELQAWLAPLRVVLASCGGSIQQREMFYIDAELRKKILSVKDGAGRSLLHRAADVMKPSQEASEVFNSRLVQLACWLVENGCNPDQADQRGCAPLHIATSACNLEFAAGLVFKGCDLEPEDDRGHKPLELLPQDKLGRIMTRGLNKTKRDALKPRPVNIPDLTYVSVYFAAHMMAHTSELNEPFLTITVRNSRGHDVEEAQSMSGTALEREEYVYWGQTWHMQTALENLDDRGKGTSLVVELKDTAQSGNHRETMYGNDGQVVTLAWASMELDGNLLDTKNGVQLEMFEGAYEYNRSGKRAQVEADRFLQVDTIVQKKAAKEWQQS